MMSWLKKWQRPITVIGILAIIGGGIWLLYNKGPLGPPKVTITKAHKEDLKPAVFGIGTVEARLSYTVGPIQAGRLLSAAVDHGDMVKVGQVLGEIDPVDLDSKLQSASSAVAKAQSAMVSNEAQVRDTYSRNVLAQNNNKRYQELLAQQAISVEAADSKQNEANAAQAAYDSAKAVLAAAREEISKSAADLKVVEQQRANLKLLSPVNGLVVSRDVEPGATVVAGQSVFHLVDPATMWVRTRIDQSRFYGISLGQTAIIILRSSQDVPLKGKVLRLEVQGDSVTEERFVDVAFDDLAGRIPLGELAEVSIDLPPVSDALVVPTAAVKRINKQNGVWLLDEGKLHFQPVVIGAQTLDGNMQIIEGLKAGGSVVVYSPKQPTEGMKVRVEKKL